MSKPEKYILLSSASLSSGLGHKESRCRLSEIQTRIFLGLLSKILQELHRDVSEQLRQSSRVGKRLNTHQIIKNINDHHILRWLGG